MKNYSYRMSSLANCKKWYLWVTLVTSQINLHYLYEVKEFCWLTADQFIHLGFFNAQTAAEQELPLHTALGFVS